MYVVHFNGHEELGYVVYPSYFDESQVRKHVFEKYREYHPVIEWKSYDELDILILTNDNITLLDDFEKSL